MHRPHGRKLIDRTLKKEERKEVTEQIPTMQRIAVSKELVKDIENIATGVFSSLEGFVKLKDYIPILNNIRLSNDLPWAILIVPDVAREEANKITKGEGVVVRDYHIYLDKKIGQLLPVIDDETPIFVVSDHGAKRMKGAICVNDWLVREGHLVLKEKLHAVTGLLEAGVDWAIMENISKKRGFTQETVNNPNLCKYSTKHIDSLEMLFRINLCLYKV